MSWQVLFLFYFSLFEIIVLVHIITHPIKDISTSHGVWNSLLKSFMKWFYLVYFIRLTN